MWMTTDRLTAGTNVKDYGVLVDDPQPLYRDGLVVLDFGFYGVEIMSLDAEVFVIRD